MPALLYPTLVIIHPVQTGSTSLSRGKPQDIKKVADQCLHHWSVAFFYGQSLQAVPTAPFRLACSDPCDRNTGNRGSRCSGAAGDLIASQSVRAFTSAPTPKPIVSVRATVPSSIGHPKAYRMGKKRVNYV